MTAVRAGLAATVRSVEIVGAAATAGPVVDSFDVRWCVRRPA